MSVQAITWVLEDAPDLPHNLVSTLIGLANHADRHGRGAFPGQATLADYTRKSDRAIRDDLKALMKLGLIRLGDQRLVAHIRPDQRPVVYDLAMDRKRDRKAASGRKPTSARKPSSDRKPISGRKGATAGSTVPGGSVLPAGSTASQRPEVQRHNDRKPASDEPSSRTVIEPPPLRSSVNVRVAAALRIEEDEAERVIELVATERRPTALGRYVDALIVSGDIAGFLARVRSPTPAPAAPAYIGPTHLFDDDGDGMCMHCPLPADHPCHRSPRAIGA